MRIVNRIFSRLKLHNNLSNFRHPTLTRMMINPPVFKTGVMENQFEFSQNCLKQICHSFQAANYQSQDQDIWTEISGNSKELADALKSQDITRLQSLLSNLFASTITHGMAHAAVFVGPKSPYGPNYFSMRIRDSTLALAEALAIKGLDSFQQNSFEEFITSTNADLNSYIGSITDELGHSLETPDFGGAPYAQVGDTRLNPDCIRHAYIMHRVQQLGFGTSGRLLEIGGGFGCVARYAFLRGYTDYTIVDLPFANAIQTGFLSATLGEQYVAGYKENKKTPIKTHPSSQKSELKGRFDLAINMDALPEINRKEALDYLKLIRSKSRFFLSINQEAKQTSQRGRGVDQHSVPELISELGGFKRLHRHPYWMEQGYAEELYEIV